MAEFVANLDRINALADGASGFVWRLQNDSGNATEFRPFADEMLIVNMSVWESLETLKDYVYEAPTPKLCAIAANGSKDGRSLYRALVDSGRHYPNRGRGKSTPGISAPTR